jgi:hypothetical protein
MSQAQPNGISVQCLRCGLDGRIFRHLRHTHAALFARARLERAAKPRLATAFEPLATSST